MALPAIQTSLTCMGFTQEAADFITDDQDMNDLSEFKLMTDKEVESLCKVVRRPGGTIPNPSAAVAGQPPTIPNPGIPVSQHAENNLKLMCFYLRFRDRTSRTLDTALITLENVRNIKYLKEWEEEHKDVEKPEINAKDWPKTIEAIKEWLRGCLGVTKIPLAYVIRDDEEVPAHGDDPSTNYGSLQDELIRRAPIKDANDAYVGTYLTD